LRRGKLFRLARNPLLRCQWHLNFSLSPPEQRKERKEKPGEWHIRGLELEITRKAAVKTNGRLAFGLNARLIGPADCVSQVLPNDAHSIINQTAKLQFLLFYILKLVSRALNFYVHTSFGQRTKAVAEYSYLKQRTGINS